MGKQITKEEFTRFLSKLDERHKIFANINTQIGNLNIKVSIPIRLELNLCNDEEITFIGVLDESGSIISERQSIFVIKTWDLYIEFDIEDYYGVTTMIVLEDEELCLKTDADIGTVNGILNELYF